MVIQWIEERHALGIPRIDREHQELFQIANGLAQAQDRPDGPTRKAGMAAGLKRLYAYCHFHFHSEEELMQTYGFPGLPAHRRIHREFTDRVRTWLAETRDAPHPDLSAVLDALVAWILGHILGEDRTYAAYFRSQGLEFAEEEASDRRMLQEWDRHQLSLEIQGIDGQHKELIRILQQANDLVLAAPDRRKAFLPGVIRKLFYYSQYHFSYEEELMSRHGYGALAAHRDLHSAFVRQVLRFSEEFRQGAGTLPEELAGFLKDWIVHHILEEDRRFKDSMGTGG